MLESIAPYADYILSVCHIAICLVVVSFIWAGRREQHTLYVSSLGYIILLSVLGLAQLSVGLVFAAATDFLGSALWGIVAGERLCQGLRRRSSSRPTSNG